MVEAPGTRSLLLMTSVIALATDALVMMIVSCISTGHLLGFGAWVHIPACIRITIFPASLWPPETWGRKASASGTMEGEVKINLFLKYYVLWSSYISKNSWLWLLCNFWITWFFFWVGTVSGQPSQSMRLTQNTINMFLFSTDLGYFWIERVSEILDFETLWKFHRSLRCFLVSVLRILHNDCALVGW